MSELKFLKIIKISSKKISDGFGCWKWHILVITQALVRCLIYMHSPSGAVRPWASCIYIRQRILACVITYAKQKHPRCKKRKAKSEAPVSSYSYMRLKSLILVAAKAQLSCLLATENVRSITDNFQKVQSFTLDVQQFEHN